MKTKAIEKVIAMYIEEFHADSYTSEAEAELAVFCDENTVLVDWRKLKKIERAGEGQSYGHSCSACPVCGAHLTLTEKHYEGCWLAALIKDVPGKPKKDEEG